MQAIRAAVPDRKMGITLNLHSLKAATDSPGPYLGIPVWVDAGDQDPFRHTGLDEFAEQLRAGGADIQFHIWPGGHGGDYWHAHFADYLRFYARALARCR